MVAKIIDLLTCSIFYSMRQGIEILPKLVSTKNSLRGLQLDSSGHLSESPGIYEGGR